MCLWCVYYYYSPFRQIMYKWCILGVYVDDLDDDDHFYLKDTFMCIKKRTYECGTLKRIQWYFCSCWSFFKLVWCACYYFFCGVAIGINTRRGNNIVGYLFIWMSICSLVYSSVFWFIRLCVYVCVCARNIILGHTKTNNAHRQV